VGPGNGDAILTVDEIITGTPIALESQEGEACPPSLCCSECVPLRAGSGKGSGSRTSCSDMPHANSTPS